jgi:hypothetical protein
MTCIPITPQWLHFKWYLQDILCLAYWFGGVETTFFINAAVSCVKDPTDEEIYLFRSWWRIRENTLLNIDDRWSMRRINLSSN